MTFLQVFGGCYAHWRDLGPRPRRGESSGGESTVAVDVRVFTDELVVRAPTPGWPVPEPTAIHLHRDRVERVELGKGRGLRRWSRFRVAHATFDFVDGGDFDLMVDRDRAAELASILRLVYGSRFRA